MLHENEVVMLALGAGVHLFALRQRRRLEQVSGWPLLWAAYRLLLLSWAATVAESFVLPTALNLVEHGATAASALLLAVWCWRVAVRGAAGEAGEAGC